MNWELHLKVHAKKRVRRFPKKDRLRIAEALSELGDNPYSGDIEKLKGEQQTWRRRVGAYRIEYEINVDEKIVHVYEIKRRTSSSYS